MVDQFQNISCHFGLRLTISDHSWPFSSIPNHSLPLPTIRTILNTWTTSDQSIPFWPIIEIYMANNSFILPQKKTFIKLEGKTQTTTKSFEDLGFNCLQSVQPHVPIWTHKVSAKITLRRKKVLTQILVVFSNCIIFASVDPCGWTRALLVKESRCWRMRRPRCRPVARSQEHPLLVGSGRGQE